MVHQLTCQAWLIIADQRDAILARNIFRRNDHELIPVNSRTEVDLSDQAARNTAANRRAEEHVRQNHVVDVLRPAGYLVAPLLAGNRLPDDVLAVHIAFRNRCRRRGWDSVCQTGSDGERKCRRSGLRLCIASVFTSANLAPELTIGKDGIA